MSQQTDVRSMWSGKIAESHLLLGAKLIIWHFVSKHLLVITLVAVKQKLL